MEPLGDNNPANPRRPSGGTALLLMLVLGLIVAGLLIWAFVRTDPGQPSPASAANPKVLPGGAAGGGGAPH